MAYELIGKDFTPPDVHAKVTGKAKYAEDFRVDGMAFCKLLTSPMPHARVKRLDTAKALALPGVLGVLTADDVEKIPEPQDPILTHEPLFVGQPILAIAAESEQIAADALELVEIDYEELPFCVDTLASLYPGGPEARSKTVNWLNPACFIRTAAPIPPNPAPMTATRVTMPLPDDGRCFRRASVTCA